VLADLVHREFEVVDHQGLSEGAEAGVEFYGGVKPGENLLTRYDGSNPSRRLVCGPNHEKRQKVERETVKKEEQFPVGLKLALSTFGLLVLELATIRWLSGQVRIFAYFNNLVLISAFLGMGLGVALSQRRPRLAQVTPYAFLALVGLVTLGTEFGLSDLTFPDPSVHLWGAERGVELSAFFGSLAIMLLLVGLVVGAFLCAGAVVGKYFRQLQVLEAYSWDLIGSLLGVVAMAIATAYYASPPVWFALGAIPFLVLSPGVLSSLAVVGTVAVAWVSTGDALHSAYNRIELTRPAGGDIVVSVNRDFHQYLHDLSDERLATEPDSSLLRTLDGTRRVYDLPYGTSPRKTRALVVGAGTGNDARAALRNGFEEVWAVDIDARIIEIGRQLHPEKPYADPRVHIAVNDARAFFEQYDGDPFDVVSFGFLDSHSMFSAMSSLRLENYVYTTEGLTSAWKLVTEGGVMSLTFSVGAGEWISGRLAATLLRATGVTPQVVRHNLNGGTTYLITKGVENNRASDMEGVFPVGPPTEAELAETPTSDDWPFLYVRPGAMPWGYVVLLSFFLLGAFGAVRATFGRDVMGGGFDPPLFFLGAAFLLLETRGITQLSLLFGSTWVVNTAVFGGILIVALAANHLVAKKKAKEGLYWFVPLFLALGLLWILPVAKLNVLPMLVRGLVGGIAVVLPVGFAGIIVSQRLAKSDNPTASLGSNLIGAVLGGCLEYFSMVFGLRALILFAALFYLAAMVSIARGPFKRAVAPPTS
jgi:spermine/spermidine synthase